MSKESKHRVHPISVSEARERLNKVRDILEQIEPVHQKFVIQSRKLVKASKTQEPQTIARIRYEVDQIENELESYRVELLDIDCVIKDFDTGLVDFVALKGETPVWLCYKKGEEELNYYHGWKAGYKGRKHIDFE